MLHLRPLCCDCGDCAVHKPGDRCDECADFLAEATRPGWGYVVPGNDAYDLARDALERFMETRDAT
jgi:hypothetical protein